jgi:hypothetical protein
MTPDVGSLPTPSNRRDSMARLRYLVVLSAGLALLAGPMLTPAASAKGASVKCPNFSGGPGPGAPKGNFYNIKVSGVSCRLADKAIVAFTKNPPGGGCSPSALTCSVDVSGGVFKYYVKPMLVVPGKLIFVGQPPKYKGDTITAGAKQ